MTLRSELSAISDLLDAFDCQDLRWLEVAESRAVKKRVKFFYSQTWPDDRHSPETNNLSGWDGLNAREILIE